MNNVILASAAAFFTIMLNVSIALVNNFPMPSSALEYVLTFVVYGMVFYAVTKLDKESFGGN